MRLVPFNKEQISADECPHVSAEQVVRDARAFTLDAITFASSYFASAFFAIGNPLRRYAAAAVPLLIALTKKKKRRNPARVAAPFVLIFVRC